VFYEHGVQLTRSFRALKLWMSLRVFGLAAFRETIDRGIALAEEAEQMLRADVCWDVVTPAQLAVVTFAPRLTSMSLAEANARVERAVERLTADGYAMVTSTRARPNRTALLPDPSRRPDRGSTPDGRTAGALLLLNVLAHSPCPLP
jgi:glutamate/tyrosine decarboxylase-like PLP-dependent enzyme